MKERLLILLENENLSASKFADLIGVQRSSVSHILTGRNKPSFDFLQKTLKAFPGLNADWLILNEGEMYEGSGGPAGNLFDSVESVEDKEVIDDGRTEKELKERVYNGKIGNIRGQREAKIETVDKNVIRVVIFYEDGTFSSFEPSN